MAQNRSNRSLGVRLSRNGNREPLSTLRDTLLPKLISGELRVKDAEVIAAKTLWISRQT